MDVSRFGTACWRPLCPYAQSCGRTRARTWADMWLFLAMEDREPLVRSTPSSKSASEHIKTEQNMDIPIVTFREEYVEVLQIPPEETPEVAAW